MSDEEDSMSEAFSASEDEWMPSKDIRGGESSDDDDSDFEGETLAGAASGGSGTSGGKKRGGPKARSATKQISKKRTGLSLRAKLYNKYRPPPKTLSPPSSLVGKNSPTASTSGVHSKNATTPNESKSIRRKTNNGEDSDSSSDSSIDNYLVNIEDLDIQSSFFNIEKKLAKKSSDSPVPNFDCNAGLQNLSDSASDVEKDGSRGNDKAFDFNNLLQYAKSLENLKENVRKHNAEESKRKSLSRKNVDTLDVYAVLALGEKQQNRSHNDGEDEDDEGDEGLGDEKRSGKSQPSKLSKTKSTRVKRHTKTRPSSTVATNDTDDSEWEEVADHSDSVDSGAATSSNISQAGGNLEIYVELQSGSREKKTKTQQDIEMAFKRRLNRDMKERQVLLHKVSLLCHFGRAFSYNRLLNDTILMKNALKLLPSKAAYPPERGTEIKYFQSMVVWFKSSITLQTQNLYPEKSAAKTKSKAHIELLKQIEQKEARCKQDAVFIFIILLRGMGLQCRLITNIQPLPLKPAQSDLIAIKMKKDDASTSNPDKSSIKKDADLQNKTDMKHKTFPKVQVTKGETIAKETKKEAAICENISEESSKSKTNNTNKVDNKKTNKTAVKSRTAAAGTSKEKAALKSQTQSCEVDKNNSCEELGNSQKENEVEVLRKPHLSRLKRTKAKDSVASADEERSKKKPLVEAGSVVVPKIIVESRKEQNLTDQPSSSRAARRTRSGGKSPQAYISPAFLVQSTHYADKFPDIVKQNINVKNKNSRVKSPNNNNTTNTCKTKISTDFLQNKQTHLSQKRVLRSRQKQNETQSGDVATTEVNIQIAQLDGANDEKYTRNKKANLKKIKSKRVTEECNSDEDFEPSPPKKPKTAPALSKRDRRVLSTDDEIDKTDSAENVKRKQTAGDMWVEVWCDVEEQWVCVDLFKGKIHCIDTIRKSASASLAYVFAFQNDLSIKDVTARYCPNWTTTIRKSRVEKEWLDAAIAKYLGDRTKRDIKEDQELRRIHEEKPMPTAISDYKNHPFYALERHLLKFEALYPPTAPALGYVRGEAVYSRDCVHTLRSRDIWLKQARTVKLGEKPYKIVKARPKWDRITQTVIKDQPLEVFGHWQTEDYEPPTAENGLVPRNAYGNVELFKSCMLPKKTKHIRLPGLNRICKKMGIDCANAVVGFDFHQGACHPTYDGFIVCEEFEDQVVAAWYEDQEEQDRKQQEKYEARVYGNWKKLIRGLLIRQRLKLKYNF